MVKIALSYRREDSKAATHMLFSRLQIKFGRNSTFLDFDSIGPGVDFRRDIADTLQHCDLVLAVIGPRWLGQANNSRRIDDPADWVRVEIETAIENKVPIIPVLIDDTPMPRSDDLPGTIREISFLNALKLDTGVDFSLHSDRLIKAIETRFPQRQDGAPDVSKKSGKLIDETSKIFSLKRWLAISSVAISILIISYVGLRFFPHAASDHVDIPNAISTQKTVTDAAPPDIESDKHDAGWEVTQGDAANKAQDYNTAYQWYRRAADKGSARAKAMLGIYYYLGNGVDSDDQKSVEWTREAANEGDVIGMHNLAEAYQFGIGVPRDTTKATSWFRKAADLGDPNSEYNMGWAYQDGFGVPKDETVALQWFTKAANHGQFAAMEQLGEFYAYGNDGLRKDPVLARMWITRAAQGGNSNAKAWLRDHPE